MTENNEKKWEAVSSDTWRSIYMVIYTSYYGELNFKAYSYVTVALLRSDVSNTHMMRQTFGKLIDGSRQNSQIFAKNSQMSH